MQVEAAILTGPAERLIIDTVQLGEPGHREVLVEISASGICHSQLEMIKAPLALPMLLGHEATGVVVCVGDAVHRVAVGDHVLIAAVPTSPAGEDYPVGPSWSWRGTAYEAVHNDRMNLFTWATHTLVDERNLTPVSRGIPLDVSAVLGCAAVTGCGSVINIAQVQPGDSVAVWGAGGVGCCSIIAAAALGADPIVAVDVDDAKLELACRLGATVGVNATREDPVARVNSLTDGGAQYVFDTVGRPADVLSATRSGVAGRHRGGTAVAIGGGAGQSVDIITLLRGAKTYVRSLAGDGRPTDDLQRYVDWYQRGLFPLEQLVTRRYQLAQINEALDDLSSGRILGRAIVEMTAGAGGSGEASP